MNIITFDIEEWYLESIGQKRAEKFAEYDRYLEAILEKLEQRGIKATFFCVGEMARLYPQVLKKIQSHGHEIGCHSNIHTWINKMSEEACRLDTQKAVDSLEQCVGEKVLAYRAPAFSIGEQNKWAFGILAENGIVYDASVFPAKRDFGGFEGFGIETPCLVEYNGIRLKEFPVSMTTLLGKRLAYSGGGYFRFFPLSFVRREMSKKDYAMCYFHIGDLVAEMTKVMTKQEYEAYFKEPGSLKARYVRYIKSSLGIRHAFDKMLHLLDATELKSIGEADKAIDWNDVKIVKL
ncbi:MAG: polysaccharide deacetylase family protein [Bacteroidales bacterium]|nr:polysaccharide deacetylase family protein [Bacteroidales bacterium]